MKTIFGSGSIILLYFIFTTLMTSCEKDEKYQAKITVVNNSGANIENITFRDLTKKIDKLEASQSLTFDYEWIASHTQLFGSYNRYELSLDIEYTIGTNRFDRSNEKRTDNDILYYEVI